MLRCCYCVLSLTFLALVACRDEPTEPSLAPGAHSEAVAVASDTWQQRAKMRSDRRYVITATVGAPNGGSFLYAIGGQSMNSTRRCSSGLSKVQAYDGNTDTWSFRASLPLPLQRSIAGVIDGKIYVAGGCSGANQPQDGLWEYDVAADRWIRKAYAPISLADPVGAVADDKLYVYASCSWSACEWDGDATGREQYTFFGFYDPATDQWTRRPLPPQGVGNRAVAAFTGKLYFLGHAGSVHIYDPGTGAWTTGTGRSGPEFGRVTTAVIQSKWYIVENGALSVYTPATDTWTQGTPPPAEYVSNNPNEYSAGRVWADGIARLHLVGGSRPDNNWQYTP